MPLNTLGLVAGIAVARREGVAPDQVARVALPGAIFPNLALGVIVVDRLAQQVAAAEAAQAPPTAGTTTTTTQPPPPSGKTTGVVTQTMLPIPMQYPSVQVAPPVQTWQPGQTLVVDPGQWTHIPAGAEPTYQWFRNGEDIDGATNPEYKIREKDRDHWLTVEVTYTDVSTNADVSTRSEPIWVGTPRTNGAAPSGQAPESGVAEGSTSSGSASRASRGSGGRTKRSTGTSRSSASRRT